MESIHRFYYTAAQLKGTIDITTVSHFNLRWLSCSECGSLRFLDLCARGNVMLQNWYQRQKNAFNYDDERNKKATKRLCFRQIIVLMSGENLVQISLRPCNERNFSYGPSLLLFSPIKLRSLNTLAVHPIITHHLRCYCIRFSLY